MPEIYLDNNATTSTAPEVVESLLTFFSKSYGNPSSLHRLGLQAERAVDEARRGLSGLLVVHEDEIVFTSGGTESANLAVKGAAQACKRKGNHIITTTIEHDAVLGSVKQLEQAGFIVDFAKVDTQGKVSPESVVELIKPNTILVAVMHVNNELGSINPINEIAESVKAKNKGIIFFSDGAQAFGKLEIDLTHIDLYSISGHKFHAPKGSGALYVKKKTLLQPLISGGGQEFDLRSGTQNVPNIVGLAKAARLAYGHLKETREYWRELMADFLEGLKNIPEVKINSPVGALENTLNVSFNSIPSQVMMNSLEEKGIYVSAGSACSGAKGKPSHVLKAIGLPPKRIRSAIRFSFSRYNTHEEIHYVLENIQSIIYKLKKYYDK
ncbi:cysteine desulfurase family protein [Coxiella endosymbiont of Ornithodoros maritimus]|uniref:cysteine desulfurase family protein n=1 Tax=Coxiella endosymbiont of Ornithodoros maritimus TaxID=1656172 RepID=UPI00226433C3|nr:cysteine desulfurase family protein [Coxiella endosymbiont of Ornithodoros maritimus]